MSPSTCFGSKAFIAASISSRTRRKTARTCSSLPSACAGSSKRQVVPRYRTWPDARAGHRRSVAHDEQVAHGQAAEEVAAVLRLGIADVDADLGHHLDGQRVDLGGRGGPAAADGEAVAVVLPQEALGHLAPAGVAGAKHQHHRLAAFVGGGFVHDRHGVLQVGYVAKRMSDGVEVGGHAAALMKVQQQSASPTSVPHAAQQPASRRRSASAAISGTAASHTSSVTSSRRCTGPSAGARR